MYESVLVRVKRYVRERTECMLEFVLECVRKFTRVWYSTHKVCYKGRPGIVSLVSLIRRTSARKGPQGWSTAQRSYNDRAMRREKQVYSSSPVERTGE